MKDETISAGDTVQVVRGPTCCGIEDYIGLTTTVKRVDFLPRPARCTHCGTPAKSLYVETEDVKHHDEVFMLSQLKKIHPPEDGEQTLTPADIGVTA